MHTPKMIIWFGHKGKEDMEILKIFDHVGIKYGNSHFFFTVFDTKMGISILFSENFSFLGEFKQGTALFLLM